MCNPCLIKIVRLRKGLSLHFWFNRESKFTSIIPIFHDSKQILTEQSFYDLFILVDTSGAFHLLGGAGVTIAFSVRNPGARTRAETGVDFFVGFNLNASHSTVVERIPG